MIQGAENDRLPFVIALRLIVSCLAVRGCLFYCDAAENLHLARMISDEVSLYGAAVPNGCGGGGSSCVRGAAVCRAHDVSARCGDGRGARNLHRSDTLSAPLGACALDVEMETGTGKTYVYSKTMFELNCRYGWSKFIVVVPSIAIREGVKKSFEMTAEHFMEQYGRKA